MNKNSPQAIADAVQDTLEANQKELISKLPGNEVTEDDLTVRHQALIASQPNASSYIGECAA